MRRSQLKLYLSYARVSRAETRIIISHLLSESNYDDIVPYRYCDMISYDIALKHNYAAY